MNVIGDIDSEDDKGKGGEEAKGTEEEKKEPH